jgi:hypothetical protein
VVVVFTGEGSKMNCILTIKYIHLKKKAAEK